MGLKLKSFTISNFRGIDSYTLNGFEPWTSFTGENSSNKSSIVEGLSFLGSNVMHSIKDIPARLSNGVIDPRNVTVSLSYSFKLTEDFVNFISDTRIVEYLALHYQKQIDGANYQPTKEIYQRSLDAVTENTMVDNLASALRAAYNEHFYERRQYYSNLFDGESPKRVTDLFDSIKHIKLNINFTLSDGPVINIYFLGENEEEIFGPSALYHWFSQTDAIDDFSFSWVIGALYIKIVSNSTSGSYHIPSMLAHDSANINEFIEYNLSHYPDIFVNLYLKFSKIFGTDIQISLTPPGQLAEEVPIIVRENNNRGIALSNLSNGYLHVLRILFQLSSSRPGDIIIIDEPELHLHPGAEKLLRTILNDEKDNVQIITVTHSPIFLDWNFIDKIYLCRKEEVPEEILGTELDSALSAIGADGLDALLYSIVIWYEGPSDKIYLEKWLNLFKSDIRLPIENIGLIHYGGTGNLQHFEPENVKKICRNAIFLVDSDKTNATDPIAPWKIQFQSECSSYGLHCWITSKREIENYLPAVAIENTYSIPLGTLVMNDFEDTIETLFTNGHITHKKKRRIAQEIEPNVTLAAINTDSTIKSEINNEFIQKINSYT